jgi:hypothetical protein
LAEKASLAEMPEKMARRYFGIACNCYSVPVPNKLHVNQRHNNAVIDQDFAKDESLLNYHFA